MKAATCSWFPLAPFGMAGLAVGLWLSGSALSVWADLVTVDSPLRTCCTATNVAVFWQLPAECATNLSLQSALSLSGPWSTIPDATQPFIPLAPTEGLFFRTALSLPPGGANPAEIAQTVRAFAFGAQTNLNPATEFDIRIEPVRDVWEQLQVQVLVVRYLLQGQELNRVACALHDGALTPLGQSFGGYGLMSGLVQGQSFYFTYSWGSGLHRSHVGKLQLVEGKVQLWDAGSFYSQDLFLARGANGAVTVQLGQFESFNGWREAAAFGWIDESDPGNTKLVGLDGTVLALFLPVNP